MVAPAAAENFPLELTSIAGAAAIKVYKIDPTTDPPNQWIELDYTTTINTVRFTMSVEDPPVVFAALPTPPPPPVPVGGMLFQVNRGKLLGKLLAPWISFGLLLSIVTLVVVFKKRIS